MLELRWKRTREQVDLRLFTGSILILVLYPLLLLPITLNIPLSPVYDTIFDLGFYALGYVAIGILLYSFQRISQKEAELMRLMSRQDRVIAEQERNVELAKAIQQMEEDIRNKVMLISLAVNLAEENAEYTPDVTRIIKENTAQITLALRELRQRRDPLPAYAEALSNND